MDNSTTLTQIGKYEILGIAGRGGMGVVYHGKDKFIGREVAIKTLTDATPELRQRFLDSDVRSGALNHPNIVTLYDFGEFDGNPYIVMEYLSGESLQKVLDSKRPMSMLKKLDAIREVCDGLGYAHQEGVVHRDIKPANIMVQPNGHIKIIDFGIARQEDISGNTVTGGVIGTFHYIPPERLKGEAYDGRADIWAVGIMLYELLTGRLPFPGEQVSALHRVITEPFDPLSNSLNEYPPALDLVLDRALAKNPDDRYQTAEEMASDLEAISEQLKRERVSEKLSEVKQLMEQEQFTAARTMLFELQRLDQQNTEIRRLVREVNDKLSRQLKSEQIRQLTRQAEEAALSQKYGEAVEFYKQAGKLDPAIDGLTEKIEHLRVLKERAEKKALLEQQAREARLRNDLGNAMRYIEEALKLDERDTNLRNELVRIVQESERLAREGTRRKLLEAGREQLAMRQYTGALENLREALQLDPTDAEVQQLFQDTVARQEEERRRKVIDQIVAQIEDCVVRKDFTRALEIIHRALERLPGEAVLLRLKAEAEKAHREATVQTLVSQTSLDVQNLFQSNPQEALARIQAALDQLPGEPRLIALQDRVVEQLKKANIEGLRAQYLKRAQASLDARQFDQAIQILETASIDCGEAPDIAYLLEHVRSEKQAEEQGKLVAATVQKAQMLIGNGELETAIALLQPIADQTGSPAVEQLLRQTNSSLAEVARRIDAVVERVKTLGEQDAVQALQLLLSQPQAIQQHSKLRELRARLDKNSEHERVTREAIQKTQNLLDQQNLGSALDPLESVRRAYGDSKAITAAIFESKSKRMQIANAILTTSMQLARQQILANDPAKALEALEASAKVMEFADAATQADWKRLAQEAAKAGGPKRATTGTVQIVVKSGGLSVQVIAGIVAAALLLVGGLVWYLVSGSKPAMTSYMQLNASPYAEVMSITSDKGNAIQLPNGDHNTPLRIDNIPYGNYVVTFKFDGDSVPDQETCTVGGAESQCIARKNSQGPTDAEIQQIIGGQK
jgi:serine/threonine protein kinase